MPFLQDAQAWLNGQMQKAAGVTITYSRPATGQSVTITHDGPTDSGGAWGGRTRFVQQPAPGRPAVQVSHGEQDYLIPVAALVLGGSPSEPARGDRITEAGVGTFEVLAVPGEPIFRYSDQYRTVYRVHCKRVS